MNGRRNFLRTSLAAAGVGLAAAARSYGATSPARRRGAVLSGRGTPRASLGRPGDFYLDRRRDLLYGPKVKRTRGRTGWGKPMRLRGLTGPAGPAGSRGYAVLHGAGPPDPSVGIDGDFYVDTTTAQIFGPKASGVWGSPANLTGTQAYSRPEVDAKLATYVPREDRQPAELAVMPVLNLIPATPDFAPFQVQMRSFANTGAGEVGINHAAWMGWNAGRHAGDHEAVDGKPAMYMGLEDNYFDDVGDKTFGTEWYVGYISPDGTSVPTAELRPFYARVLDAHSNDPLKSVRAHVDIGAGTDGHFVVYSGPAKALLFVNPDRVQSTRNVLVTGNELTLQPSSGQALLSLRSNAPALTYDIAGDRAWTWLATSPGVFEVLDRNGRGHLTLHQNPNVHVARTTVNSSLLVEGEVGFYGIGPVSRPTGVPVTAEGVHAALVALGLIAP